MQLFPGDGPEARWAFEVATRRTAEGAHDFGGPYVHGRGGERFIYLSWGTLSATGEFAMFRRAKLMLAAVEPRLLNLATQRGTVLTGRLPLTDSKGMPVAAAIRPPRIEWTVEVG